MHFGLRKETVKSKKERREGRREGSGGGRRRKRKKGKVKDVEEKWRRSCERGWRYGGSGPDGTVELNKLNCVSLQVDIDV